MEEEKELLLRDLYTKASIQGNFLTQHQLYEQANRHEKQFTREDIRHFLEGQRLYSKFKRYPGVTTFRKTKVYDLGDQLQIDLVLLSKYKEENDDYQYILVAIEILSRSVFAQPLKTRDASAVAKALEDVLDDVKTRFHDDPKFIQMDEGNEFKGAVHTLLKKRDISYFSTHSKRQATLVERVNRTLQEKLRKFWEKEEDHEWVSHLAVVVQSINAQHHRRLGMSPNEVTEENKFTVWGRLYGIALDEKRKPKFKVNDLVRVYHFQLLHRATPTFRSYYQDKYGKRKNIHRVEEKHEHPFSDELFRILKIRALDGLFVYQLRHEEADENILGYFYENELSVQR